MAYQQDLEWDCGADIVVEVQLYDGETGTVALNLTGVTEIRYRVARQLHPDWPVLLTKLKSTGGIAVIGPATDGLISITFADTDTKPVAGERLTGIFEHELRLTDGSGNVTALFSGRATINPTGPA